MDIEKRNIADFIAQKHRELQQITNNLQTTNTNTDQINRLLTTSTEVSTKISALLDQQVHNINTHNTNIAKQKRVFDENTSNLNEKIRTLESQIEELEKHAKVVEDKKILFEERNEFLQNLIGREVSVSLCETFKQRKDELAGPVKKWHWVVIGMAILTFLAIITIFTNGFGLWGDILKEFTPTQLITNTIKTFPFFFLLFYSISQYNKERNFQEEYAFKSAVALTIKAYADIIKAEHLKDELIISSVSAVYKSPTDEKRRKKEDNAIFETAKELVKTATDIVMKKN